MQRLRPIISSSVPTAGRLPSMGFVAAIGIAILTVTAPAVFAQDTDSNDCETARLGVHGYWSVDKGADAGRGLLLRPLSLTTRSPTTTMPQLAMVCRIDRNSGDVTLFGDDTPYTAPLQPEECRLVSLLGVESLRAKTADNFEGDQACGTYLIIR